MITILSHIFSFDKMPENKRRGAYGMLCGIVGIVLNLILCAGKFFAGIVSNSIAITADAVNNLSDAASSIVTLVGFKLAGQKPDSKHPFGHGRIEYISGLIVAAAILIMAFELIRDSVMKIIHPQATQFSTLAIVILAVSIGVKCYMAFYNRKVGKKIGSTTVLAVATDSMSDCVTTTVVLIAALVAHFTNLQIDGYCGVVVGLIIFYAGLSAAKDTLNPLLGQPPEEEFVQQIEEIVLHFDENVIGLHDLMVHDYGPGRRFISLHAEVPAEGDILKLHDIIDNLEMKLTNELGCSTTIHMDPIVTKDAHVSELKQQVKQIVLAIDEKLTMHDFRVVVGDTHTNIIFDIVIPYEYPKSDDQVVDEIRRRVQEELGEDHFAVIKVDKAYVL